MALTPHVFPTFQQHAFTKLLSLNAVDTLQVALIQAGTYTWNSTAYAHNTLTDFLAGSGGGALTETTGTGYARQNLTSVSVSTSATVTTLFCASPSWATSTFSALYAVFYDTTVANDLICYWDFGGTSVATATTFILTMPGSGLVQATAS